MHIARRMAEIAPFHVMELMARAKELEAQGRDIVHMEVGEPDFPTPAPIIEAAQRFIATGNVHYTHALGLPALREAIAGYYQQRHGVAVSPGRIVVTAGASAALLLALGVLTDPEDGWLLTDPGYPCNRHFIRFCEGRPQAIAVTAKDNWQPTADQVERAWTAQTRGLLLASPSNPTGTLIAPSRLAALFEVVARRGGSLVMDEIYHGLTYGCEAQTALALTDRAFVINSFSKYFGMTGWRLGWLVVPPGYEQEVGKLAQNLYISPPAPAQHAALAAFRPETIAILEARREEFRARRDRLLPGLRQLGFEIAAEPVGAFYLYADVSQLTDDSHRLALDLVEQAGVAATPGLDFGTRMPERFMRFAYTANEARLVEGLRRIEHFLEKYNGRGDPKDRRARNSS